MSDTMTPDTLAAALAQRGHLSPGAAPPGELPPGRPWFIGLVLGFAGWLAGIFSVMFAWLVFEPSTAGSMTAIGMVLLGAAFALYAIDRESAFFDQLALALSIAGQLALTGAIGQATTWELATTSALVAILQGVLIFVMPNRLARFLATFFACIAWAIAIRSAWWPASDFSIGRANVALIPAVLSWLAIWLPVAALAWLLIAREAAWMASVFRNVLRPMLGGLLAALAFGTFVTAPWDQLDSWLSPARREVNWLVVWPLLSMLAAMLVALWAYRLRHAALIGSAVVAAFLHVAMFYYLLGSTLLIKSCIMLGAGVVMLGIGALLRQSPALPGKEATT